MRAQTQINSTQLVDSYIQTLLSVFVALKETQQTERGPFALVVRRLSPPKTTDPRANTNTNANINKHSSTCAVITAYTHNTRAAPDQRTPRQASTDQASAANRPSIFEK